MLFASTTSFYFNSLVNPQTLASVLVSIPQAPHHSINLLEHLSTENHDMTFINTVFM